MAREKDGYRDALERIRSQAAGGVGHSGRGRPHRLRPR